MDDDSLLALYGLAALLDAGDITEDEYDAAAGTLGGGADEEPPAEEPPLPAEEKAWAYVDEKSHQPNPPHPGLVFDESRHRWVSSESGEADTTAEPSKDEESGRVDDLPGKWDAELVQPKTADGVMSIIDQWDRMDYYGLRMHHDSSGGTPTVNEGDLLGDSWVWADDEKTDEKLDGTSTIGFDPDDPESLRKALELSAYYSMAGTWLVVGSNDWRGRGQDRGEVLLKKPMAIGILRG